MSKLFISQAHSYQIREVLGDNPFTTVYLADRYDKKFNIKQAVIIKLYKESSFTLLQMESLLRARYCTHLVKILSFETFNSQPALILEYIRGFNLLQILKNHELNKEEVDYICVQIMEGLKELKQNALVHGDLSLSNILIDASAHVYLTDYGLANYKLAVYSTPVFTAPEIFKGNPAGFESDLFSLGVIEKLLRQNCSKDSLHQLKNTDFVCSDEELLNPDPGKRKIKHFNSLPKAGLSLVKKVQSLFFIREQLQKTKLSDKLVDNSFKKHKYSYYFLSCISFFFLLVSFSVNPFISYGKPSPIKDPAHLSIRTQKWVHIKIGFFQSYNPVDIYLPQACSYQLKWKTYQNSGVKHINFKPGEKLLLRDNDFY